MCNLKSHFKFNEKHFSKMSALMIAAGLLSASSSLTGCTTTVATPLNVPPIVEKPMVTIPRLPSKDQFLTAQGSNVKQAIAKYEKTGQAPTITTSQIVEYPFGQIMPDLTCSPLHTCDLALEKSEIITGVYPGDNARWLFETAVSGNGEQRQMHVIFKPKFAGIVTDAIITTNQRTYHITLHSVANTNGIPVAFYYPADVEKQWIALQTATRQAIQEARKEAVASQHDFDPHQLDFHYKVSAPFFSRNPVWTPLRVFNDGTQVYLQIPAQASTNTLPSLYVTNSNGDMQLVNFRVKKPYYIVDQLFQRAALVSGTGRNQQKIIISKN